MLKDSDQKPQDDRAYLELSPGAIAFLSDVTKEEKKGEGQWNETLAAKGAADPPPVLTAATAAAPSGQGQGLGQE